MRSTQLSDLAKWRIISRVLGSRGWPQTCPQADGTYGHQGHLSDEESQQGVAGNL